MSKRTLGILIVLAVVAFYTFGTGFTFFYRLLYALLLLLVIGFGWAWLNLRGIEVRLTRTSNRGQVGGYLEGRMQVINRTFLPKSWLEVAEVSDLPGHSPGRGVALVRDQSRSWRVQTYLSRRGVYHTGEVEVTSQDPFGLFQLRRRFLQPQSYIVLPATEPLPDLDPRFANLPSDSRTTRQWDHITTDVASVREYAHGDSLRRIHWPYTAKMNTLMVKQFDMGISAEAWVLLDMQRSVHAGNDQVDNTEELAVKTAAALVARMVDLSMPVGLAASGDQTYIHRPDSGLEHQGRLLETLAVVRARGATSLERSVYELGPHLGRFNTLTVITPSTRTEWVPALNSLRRQGVNIAVVLIDAQSFGGETSPEQPLRFLFANDIPVYLVKRGQSLNEALSRAVSMQREPSRDATPSGARLPVQEAAG